MLFTAIVFFITANIYILSDILNVGIIFSAIICAALFIIVNFKPCFGRLEDKKSQAIRSGVAVLEAFLIAAAGSVAMLIGAIIMNYGTKGLIINSVIAFLVLAIAFWNGIIRIYINARQLGIKWRVIGAACGMIPVVHIVVLMKLISLAKREYKTENEKELVNKARQGDMICKTKYPVLLVHGVFFRDFKHFNYWGRIPEQLERNGAVIYYGGQQSALSVADSAAELAEKIRQTVGETGCEKVNIIAHSKGGLDSRWAISNLGCDKYVASLTTVNTPHRGCKFADYLLSKAGEGLRAKVSGAYNASAKKLGDTEPDFIAAVTDLTASACERINEQCPDKAGVFYQSIGSRSVKASAGRFPLNLSYLLVDHFDGPNDGLVSVDSMVWGESFREYKPEGSRGISHGDMIDLNRENIDGFDVREAYVELVRELADRGY
jgi:triacylglycerol lipase